MAHQTGKCVPENGGAPEVDLFKPCLSPVLMCCPLKLGGVSMACAHVLGLQVLHLGEDVESARAVGSRHFGVLRQL